MSAENDFLPFAVGGGANVLSQAAYAALTSILQNGFSSGIAPSVQLNKVWRQSSIMAAVMAQFIVAETGQPAIDDGTTATLLANFTAAVNAASKNKIVLTDTGTANAYAAANPVPMAALPTATGVTQTVQIAHTNTGTSTYAPDGLAAKPIFGLGGFALQGNELPLNGLATLVSYVGPLLNGGSLCWVLYECIGGTQQVAPATQSQHALQLGQATGRLLRVTRYRNSSGTLQSSVNGAAYATASSTFTPQALTTSVYVEVLAGGASGGGAQSTTSSQYAAGSGGGGGGGARKFLTSGFNGATITVGAGGSTSSPGAAGISGGSSSFGSLVSATGGVGGSLGVATAGGNGVLGQAGGGSGSNGDSNIQGSPGGPAFYNSSSISSGVGGASAFGGGGAPFSSGTSSGVAAFSPGAGGSGGSSAPSNPTGASGGAGVSGEITVWEYA